MYNSRLYRQLLLDHSKEEADEYIIDELKKRNIDDYVEFITGYKNRIYNEENIVKYVDLVSFFQLDIQNEFSEYLFEHYILEYKYLDLICNYHCIQYIITEYCKKINRYRILTNKLLLYISFYIDIIELNLNYEDFITDDGLINCVNLQILKQTHSKRYVTTCDIFANSLIVLDAHGYSGIDDNGLKNCINLQILDATFNERITTCDPFANSLIELNAARGSGLNNQGLKNCVNLQILNASDNYNITNCDPFVNSLITLYANFNCGINDEAIKKCTKLKKVYAFKNMKITIQI